MSSFLILIHILIHVRPHTSFPTRRLTLVPLRLHRTSKLTSPSSSLTRNRLFPLFFIITRNRLFHLFFIITRSRRLVARRTAVCWLREWVKASPFLVFLGLCFHSKAFLIVPFFFWFLFLFPAVVCDFRRATWRPAAGGPFSLTV